MLLCQIPSVSASQPTIKHLLVQPASLSEDFFPIIAFVQAVENVADVTAVQVLFPGSDDHDLGFPHLVPDVGEGIFPPILLERGRVNPRESDDFILPYVEAEVQPGGAGVPVGHVEDFGPEQENSLDGRLSGQTDSQSERDEAVRTIYNNFAGTASVRSGLTVFRAQGVTSQKGNPIAEPTIWQTEFITHHELAIPSEASCFRLSSAKREKTLMK